MTPGLATGPFGQLTEPEDVYRNNPAITNSSLNIFLASERLYCESCVTKRYKKPDTADMRFGRAFHCYMLEHNDFPLRYATWTGARRQGKEWEAFAAANKDRTIVDLGDIALIESMSQAIRGNKEAEAMLNECKKEVVFRHMLGGRLARQCRVDGVSVFGNTIDLKSCDTLSAFAKGFYGHGYHRQATWYSQLVHAVTGQKTDFVFIAVEKRPPHAVGLFRINEEYRLLAEDEISRAMTRLELCLEKNEWQRDKPGVIELAPRHWEVARGQE